MKKIDTEKKVLVNKDDLFLLLDYIMVLDEKSDYECCDPDMKHNHVWRPAKRIMKEVNYKE